MARTAFERRTGVKRTKVVVDLRRSSPVFQLQLSSVSVVANGYSWPCMANAKKSKPRDYVSRWTVRLIKATRAKLLGGVYASSEAEAIEESDIANVASSRGHAA